MLYAKRNVWKSEFSQTFLAPIQGRPSPCVSSQVEMTVVHVCAVFAQIIFWSVGWAGPLLHDRLMNT